MAEMKFYYNHTSYSDDYHKVRCRLPATPAWAACTVKHGIRWWI